jgi:phage terminase large subunit
LFYFLSWRTDPARDEAWRKRQLTKYDTESDFRNQYPESMHEFFATKEGRVFPSFDTTVGGPHIKAFLPDYRMRLYTGYDNGFRHFAATLICLYDDTADILYVLGEIFWKGVDIDEIARDYRDRMSGIPRAPEAQIADTQIFNRDARKSVADHFKDYGVNWSPAWKTDEASSRAMLSTRFTQYKIVIHPDCRNTITQLTNYVWSTTSKGEKPVDKDDEAPDILRYICSHLVKGGAPTTPMEKEAKKEYQRAQGFNDFGRKKLWQAL